MSHGLVVPTNNINGTKWEQPPQIPGYILNKRTELINNDRTIVTRFNDQMIGQKQKGVDTATEALALQQAGNSMIEHKKGLLQITLSKVFTYCIELALLNWNTTMTFRIVGESGGESFEDFNPDSLNKVPVLIPSDTEYRTKYKEEWRKRNPNKKIEELDSKEYAFKQVESETRKVKFDLNVTVGAGMPANKAFRYTIMKESYHEKAITKREYRRFLIKNLGLDVKEVPETLEEQTQLGIYDPETVKQTQMQTQNTDVQGINANGNVALSQVKQQMGGDY